jgi:hypothetical protein
MLFAKQPPASPAEALAVFNRTLRLLFDHPDERGRIHAEVLSLYGLFHDATGIDAYDLNSQPAILLPSGKALSPAGAASSLLESQRTAVFLRGIYAAIRDLQQQFPGQRIRILYAGCGPFGTLLTPLTALFSPQEVGWYLLDVQQKSFDAVHRLYEAFDLELYLLGSRLTDASQFVMPATEPFHLVVSETMQAALRTETQLAIMLNLLPQLQAGALFLPQRIAIRAQALWRNPTPSREVQHDIYQDLGAVYEIGQSQHAPPAEVHLTVPAFDKPGHLHLATEIEVYGNECLSGNDTSITMPQSMRLQFHGGEQLVFRYVWQPSPGFIGEVC